MPSQARVSELLLRWETLRDQGRAASPEELCRDCPGQLPALRRLIQALEAGRPVPDAAGEAATLPPTADPFATRDPALAAEAGDTPASKERPLVPGYEVLGELGRGGMGVVYKARHSQLNRVVALKMILAGGHAGEHELARFRTEAEAVARLQHPNVVQIYEVGEADGKQFFALEYCAGGSLADKLQGTPLPAREAARLVEALARGMEAAHQKGIIHRDLKPANVLLAEDRTPKITDFGLAKKLEEAAGQTGSGDILGTPSYMAPEQAGGRAREVGPLADVYALGAILYELLTGRPPFRAESSLDTLLQALESQPAPPRLLNPKVDRDLETVCLKCLEKDPQRRYASAAALAADLERYLAGEPVQARSANLVGRIALALERSQYEVHFQAYGNMLFGFAAAVLLTEAAVTWIVLTHQPAPLLPLTLIVRLLLLGLLFWAFRPRELIAASAAGRTMWSLWIGYVATCCLLGMTYRLRVGTAAELELNLYPSLAAITGLVFCVMGSSYWGWCYAFGLAFYGLAFLMTADLRWGPLEFGVLWAVVLTVIGLRLHRLGRDRRTAPVRRG
jgi:serine/threonine-protein kinase